MVIPCWQPIYQGFMKSRKCHSSWMRVMLFNNRKLDRARKQRCNGQSSESADKHTKQHQTSSDGQTCIFCEKVAPASDLRQVMTTNLNKRPQECAKAPNDGNPNPNPEWGWPKVGEEWHVFWTDNPPIAKSCKQLAKCVCKSGCCYQNQNASHINIHE